MAKDWKVFDCDSQNHYIFTNEETLVDTQNLYSMAIDYELKFKVMIVELSNSGRSIK